MGLITTARWIKFYFKAKPYIDKIKELSSMTLTMSRFWQIVLCVLQILNLVEPLASGKVKVIVATGISIIQVVVHNFAGNVNPDGTPASVAYDPKSKKIEVDK